MAKEDLIGVVTVTYNSTGVLPCFLSCMATQTHKNFLLFAVDNDSKDDSLAMLYGCGDERVRVIANPDNLGFAEGSNQGICAAIDAGCPTVLLLNNDTEFGPALLSQLYSGLEHYQVEMACPKIMYYDEPERIWAAGGAFQPWFGYRSIHLGENQIDRGQYDRAKLVEFAPGCCLLIRKAVFEKVGLLDERYFVYVEDADFMYRAMKAGMKLMYLPEAKLLHKVGRLTGGEDSPFAIRYGTRNRIFFLLKHFGLPFTLPWLALCQVIWLLKTVGGRKNASWLAMKRNALREALRMLDASRHTLFSSLW
jgi:GT2 family glycosyltransferase